MGVAGPYWNRWYLAFYDADGQPLPTLLNHPDPQDAEQLLATRILNVPARPFNRLGEVEVDSDGDGKNNLTDRNDSMVKTSSNVSPRIMSQLRSSFSQTAL